MVRSPTRLGWVEMAVGLSEGPSYPGHSLSVRSGFGVFFQTANRLHPLGFCVSSSEKLMSFMHFHNSCTQNRDRHILLVMTGNAHKESCHKLLLIFVREKGLKQSQN